MNALQIYHTTQKLQATCHTNLVTYNLIMIKSTLLEQLSIRVSKDIGAAIDRKRIQLSSTMGEIPNRSDIIRLALLAYLEIEESDPTSKLSDPYVKKTNL
jgi:hypothetical protein